MSSGAGLIRCAKPWALTAAFVVIIILVLCLQGWTLWQGYQQAIDTYRVRAANRAQATARQVESIIKQVDLVLLNLRSHAAAEELLDGSPAPTEARVAAMRQAIQERMAQVPSIRALHLIGADGRFRFSHLDSPPQFSLSDRDYFQEQRAATNDQVRLSEPLESRLNQRWIIILSRRIQAPDGRFAGLAIATLETERLGEAMETVDRDRWVLALYDQAHRLMARWPARPGEVGRVAREPFLESIAGPASRRGPAFGESAPQLWGLQPLEGLPLLTVAGFSETGALRQWRHELTLHLVMACLLMAGCGVVLRDQARIRSSQEHYQAIFNATSDALIIQDEAARILDVNARMCELFGHSRAAALAATIDSLSAGEAAHSPAEPVARARAALAGQPQMFEWHCRRPSGGLFWAEVALRAVELGGQRRLIASVRDITARKTTENRLREQAALIGATHDAMLVWHPQKGVLFMNPAARKLAGLDETALGRDLLQVFPLRPEPAFRAARQEVAAQGSWHGELELRGSGEKIQTLDTRWTALWDADRQLESILISCNDITEKKQLERQYLRAQRMESIGTLASGVAHDLNNILSPIMIGIDMLKASTADTQAQVILTTMLESASRGRSTIRQLLAFARGGEVQKGPVRPRELLKEVAQLVQTTFPKNIRVYTDASGPPATVAADASQLHQVLMNLCVNARDAMPEGGVLFLTLESRLLAAAGARPHPKATPGWHVVFKVADSGTGIPPQVMERIFDPFFTTKPQGKGTGLGLATALGIVENHGGFILAESKVGEGSLFQVFLPATVARAESDAAAPPRVLPRGQGERILVVDDEASILRLAEGVLRQQGYEPLPAASASEALRQFERHRARLAAVLTDVMMPFGDGRQLISTLAQQAPGLPIIAMTGMATTEAREETLRLGAVEFLGKPFTAEELLGAISRVLALPTKDSRNAV